MGRQGCTGQPVGIVPMFHAMADLPTDHIGNLPDSKADVGRPAMHPLRRRNVPHDGKLFGLMLTPKTTREQAEALTELLEKHCHYMFVASLDYEGLSDEERLALTQMYDETGCSIRSRKTTKTIAHSGLTGSMQSAPSYFDELTCRPTR